MKVSVIIPLYNHAGYIEKAIKSVLEQTHADMELIIIDDGSKDNSADIAEALLKTYPNKEVHLFRQENQGAHNAINNGLAKATGDWLTVLNSDDYYHPERMEICLAELERHNAECAFSIVSHIDDDDNPIAPDAKARNWYSHTLAAENTAISISAQLLQGNIAVSSGNIIFSRRLYELTQGFRNFKLAHDWDLLLRIIPHSEPVFVKKALYYYRLHESNTSHEVNQFLHQETLDIYKDYIQSVTEHAPTNPYAPSFEHWPYNLIGFQHRSIMQEAIRNFVRFPNQEQKPEAEEVKPQPIARGNGKHITLVSHDLSLSGAPRLIADIAIYLQEQGYRPHIIGMHGGALGAELTARNISYSVLYSGLASKLHRYLPRILFFLLAPLCLLSKLHHFKGTVLCNTIVTQPVLLFIRMLMPWKKCIWYIHESVPPSSVSNGTRKGRILRWLGLRFKDKIQLWFGSKNTAALWESEGWNGEVMYWSGIDNDAPKHESKPIKRILTAGTVDPRKGGHYLFDAFAKCVREKNIPDDVVLTIVGFLPYYTEFGYDFLLHVLRSGIRDRVELVGISDKAELDKIFAKADLYVQASVMECMPIALLTAMSQNLPVITTDVDGCIEAIPDERYGWICPPRHPDALAGALADAIANPEEAHQRATQAKDLFDRVFARDVTAELLENALFGSAQKR